MAMSFGLDVAHYLFQLALSSWLCLSPFYLLLSFRSPVALHLLLNFFEQVRLQRQAKREDMLMRRLAAAATLELGWIAQQTCALAAQSQKHLLSPFLDDDAPSSSLYEGATSASGQSREVKAEDEDDEEFGFSSRPRESRPSSLRQRDGGKTGSSRMNQASTVSSNLGSALNIATEHTQEVRRA